MTSSLFVCIGASAGGVSAVQKILTAFDRPPPFSIIIVQHIPDTSEINYDLVYGHQSRVTVHEACDKMPFENGAAYFAPPGYHLLVERDGSAALSQEEPVHFARPSIDIFFESVAGSLGNRACAVLLTGANADGAQGLALVQKAGGTTMVQNPKTAEVPFMPSSALEIMKPDSILDLEKIPPALMTWSQGRAL